MFKSRQITPTQFVADFLATLTPGVIPRNQFIQWGRIESKCKEYADVVEYYQELTAAKRKKLLDELRDSLLSADDPSHLIKGSFEILGHTNDYYVSDKDNLQFEQAAQQISANDDEQSAERVASVLLDIGLERLIRQADLKSTFLGVQIGLESNRRKSVGGKVFSNWVQQLLESACGLLGQDYDLKTEVEIPYVDSRNSKQVDFAILHRGIIKIGVEANFYTTGGSKPSEIKRSYQNVNRELNGVGIELVWITDGAGYLKMKKNLEEVFRVHPNTYNYEMARRHLKDDILSFIKP
jgi:hypothetical protein